MDAFHVQNGHQSCDIVLQIVPLTPRPDNCEDWLRTHQTRNWGPCRCKLGPTKAPNSRQIRAPTRPKQTREQTAHDSAVSPGIPGFRKIKSIPKPAWARTQGVHPPILLGALLVDSGSPSGCTVAHQLPKTHRCRRPILRCVLIFCPDLGLPNQHRSFRPGLRGVMPGSTLGRPRCRRWPQT